MAYRWLMSHTSKPRRLGRPPSDPEHVIDERAAISVHRGEKAFLEELARLKGFKSLSHFIRALVYAELPKDEDATRVRARSGPWSKKAPH